MKRINRYFKKTKFLYFSYRKKIKKLNYQKFLKDNKIDDIIKLTPSEFKLASKKLFFYHFNLQWSVHKKNKKYYLIKILKHGSSDSKNLIDPILSPNLIVLSKCLFSKNGVKYNDISQKILNNSLLRKKNILSLKKLVLKKYKKILSHIDDDIKIKMGVSITKLARLKKIMLNNKF